MKNESLIKFSNVVNAIYGGIENAMGMPDWHVFLSSLLEATNSVYAYMAFGNPKTWDKRIWFCAGDLRGIENHLTRRSHLLEQAPFLSLPQNIVASVREITDLNCPAGSIFNSQILQRYGIADILGAHFVKKKEEIAHFYLGRSHDFGCYAAEQKEFCEQLLPHLNRAWENVLTKRNNLRWKSEFFDVLENMGVEVILINSRREILDTSENASEIIKEKQDFLSIHNGRLCLAVKHEEKCFDISINDVLEKGNQETLFFLISDKKCLNKIPILYRCIFDPKSFDFSPRIAIYFQREKVLRPITPQALRSIFGLTAAEAKIVIGLIDGLSMKKIAVQGGISINTAYGHLKAVFKKLDVNHQSALVSRILGSLASLGKR